MHRDSLKVLLASWAPFHAGAEVAAERLALGLQDDGHDVTVLLGTKGETMRRMQEAGLDVRWVPLELTDKRRWWRRLRAQRAVCNLLREMEPDLVHANDLPTSQMLGRAPVPFGVPRICHHRWIFEGAAVDWLNKYGAERHVYVSQALMRDLHHASTRLAASSGTVVYDGLPIPQLPTSSERAAVRARLQLPDDQCIVLFAGQIIERKGVADLLRAWEHLPANVMQQATFLFIGDDLENNGAYRRQMERLASDLSCSAIFAGYQTNVGDWLTAADVCVVPSHAEPLGNATLEAMAHALPVVGSRVGGIPEMLEDGQSGLLVPPRSPEALAAAIQRLFADPLLRQRLGAEARRRCEMRFSLSAHVTAVLDVYEDVLSRRSKQVVKQ